MNLKRKEKNKEKSGTQKITQLTGKAVPVYGNDIDTDRIIPARFLKEVTFENMGHYLFRDVRFDATDTPKEHPLNFGCGSSREHAPQSIKRAGFKAIIGESFSEIFQSNCNTLGIPSVTASAKEINYLQQCIETDPHTVIIIDLVDQQLIINGRTVVIDCVETSRQSFISGTWNVLNLLNANREQIKTLATKLGYI
jgi:3-isopropylmalate/(R)-2-methylmalate dehydratase small subunit